MTIRLHIDRVIVDGLSLTQSQASELRAALESRLTQLLSDPASMDAVGALDATRLMGRTMSLTHGVNGAAVGASVAGALHAGLIAAGGADASGGPSRER
jgi:hypothetical protein